MTDGKTKISLCQPSKLQLSNAQLPSHQTPSKPPTPTALPLFSLLPFFSLFSLFSRASLQKEDPFDAADTTQVYGPGPGPDDLTHAKSWTPTAKHPTPIFSKMRYYWDKARWPAPPRFCAQRNPHSASKYPRFRSKFPRKIERCSAHCPWSIIAIWAIFPMITTWWACLEKWASVDADRQGHTAPSLPRRRHATLRSMRANLALGAGEMT